MGVRPRFVGWLIAALRLFILLPIVMLLFVEQPTFDNAARLLLLLIDFLRSRER